MCYSIYVSSPFPNGLSLAILQYAELMEKYRAVLEENKKSALLNNQYIPYLVSWSIYGMLKGICWCREGGCYFGGWWGQMVIGVVEWWS